MNFFATDLFSTTVAAVLTLFVYSYLLHDNPLYRLAEHLLVATTIAYAIVVAVYSILLPRLVSPLLDDPTARPDLLIPLVLGVLLLGKSVPLGTKIGNPSLAYLVGVGIALATGGALVGTLLPQSTATILPVVPDQALNIFGAVTNGLIVLGTVAVLLSFMFITKREEEPLEAGEEEDGKRPVPVSTWRRVGRWFMMIAFGAIFGGTTLTYMSLLVGRWDFLLNDWLLPLLGL